MGFTSERATAGAVVEAAEVVERVACRGFGLAAVWQTSCSSWRFTIRSVDK